VEGFPARVKRANRAKLRFPIVTDRKPLHLKQRQNSEHRGLKTLNHRAVTRTIRPRRSLGPENIRGGGINGQKFEMDKSTQRNSQQHKLDAINCRGKESCAQDGTAEQKKSDTRGAVFLSLLALSEGKRGECLDTSGGGAGPACQQLKRRGHKPKEIQIRNSGGK